MNKHIPSVTTFPRVGQLQFSLLLLVSLYSGNTWGDDCTDADHHVDWNACNSQTECKYAIKYEPVDPMAVSGSIQTLNQPGTIVGVTWLYLKGTCTEGNSNQCIAAEQCFDGIDINTNSNIVTFSGTATGDGSDYGCFKLTATDLDDSSCFRDYKFHITSTGGGWGDPHITTVDGVHYDFQSAGEFIALRGDDLEIQTRQTAVSTPNISFRNGYTGLRNCVSRYTAVAALVGKHRVTIQPNLSGEPDPNGPDPAGPQIRVDGELKTLGPDGIDLSSCDCPAAEMKSDGRIVRSADEQSIEIHYASGAKVVVVPRWWGEPIHTWFFNVEVYDTTATEGIMGLTKDDWLPALSDGTTVGDKADKLDERYVQLYETFADSWRVGSEDKPSLFDYDDDTSTATFTLDEWPRHEPNSCLLEGEPKVEPVDIAVAEKACSEVVDENNRENCIFDVSATGHTGFADAYVRTEQLIPGATRTTLVQDKNSSKPGTSVTFTATVQRTVSTIGKITSGRVQFVVDGKNTGDPIEFDTDGNAVWSTSNLTNGNHEVEARFLPTGFGERFRPSSDKVTHVVSREWWLSFHVGRTAPTGNFSDIYDSSYSYILDLEYKFTPKYSFLGLLGYNHFKGASTGVDDTYWTNLSANVKYYFMRYAKSGTVWVNAGAGAYKPESGSTRAGANFGAGLGGNINPRLRWEAGVNYHNIFTSGSNTKFVVPTVGVTFNF